MTGSNWLLAVLDDLKTYANANDLQKLGDQIDLARATAQSEIAAKEQTQRLLTGVKSGHPNER